MTHDVHLLYFALGFFAFTGILTYIVSRIKQRKYDKWHDEFSQRLKNDYHDINAEFNQQKDEIRQAIQERQKGRKGKG